jgi:hypothetical protein
MLSPALSELLERARTRFGLEVEVMDASLRHVYPDGTTALARVIEGSADIRESLLGALAGGRPGTVDDAGVNYQVFPLRRAAKVRHSSALVAVRRAHPGTGASSETAAWPELARSIVEADFASADALTVERQQSRRLLATLRFLRDLVDTESEAVLAQAIVQAAAVWFDADARIFERELTGDFQLHTALPGARIESSATRLSSAWLAESAEPVRVGPIPEWGDAAGESDVVLIPLSSSGPGDWLLALIGVLPAEAERLFSVLGRVAAVQVEAFRSKRRDAVRQQFQSLIDQGGTVHELVAVRLVRALADMTGASYASLVLNRSGGARRLVLLGTPTEALAADTTKGEERRFSPSGFACTMPLGDTASATLLLSPPVDASFGREAELIARAATDVIQVWLAGAQGRLQDAGAEAAAPGSGAEFVVRIEQELERAKRFDLRLSLVVVQLPEAAVHQHAASMLQDALRRELRGSDVLGTVNGDRVAALLTHTDGSGSHHVVGRLRRRLSEAAGRLELGGVTVGQAAFSPECCTSEALLTRAASEAQPVAV